MKPIQENSICEYREPEPDDSFFYNRPSMSALVAVVAVGFAFFCVGGLIKTYRQLETVREENRREIQELRLVIKRLETSTGRPVPLRPPPEARSVPPPRASRQPQVRTRGGESAVMGTADSPEALHGLINSEAAADEEKSWITYEFGRRSPDADAQRRQLRVTQVAESRKTVMVDGGRDSELVEGTRLELSRNGVWTADLRVQNVFDNMAACEVVLSKSPPEIGDLVRMAR